jgi:hypothetical protein
LRIEQLQNLRFWSQLLSFSGVPGRATRLTATQHIVCELLLSYVHQRDVRTRPISRGRVSRVSAFTHGLSRPQTVLTLQSLAGLPNRQITAFNTNRFE